MFLGENLPSWLVLAFGAALAVGNLAALVMPQNAPGPVDDEPDADRSDGEEEAGESQSVERPPLVRSLVMIALGSAAAVWALASLLS